MLKFVSVARRSWEEWPQLGRNYPFQRNLTFKFSCIFSLHRFFFLIDIQFIHD